MKKRALVIGAIVLVLGVLGVATVPVFAADPGGSSAAPAQGMNFFGRGVMLERLLLVKDEANVDALLAKAVENQKLTSDQAQKIKTFWNNHHQQFTKKVVLRALMRIQDEAKLQEVLNQAISSGKINQGQAEKIIQAWERLYKK